MNLEIIKKEFDSVLITLEKKRKQQLRLYYIDFIYYIAGLGILVVMILFLLSDLSLWYTGGLGVTLVALLLVRYYHVGNPEVEYQKSYEKTFLKEVVRKLIPTTKLENKAESFDLLVKSGLLRSRKSNMVIDSFKGQASESLSFQAWFLKRQNHDPSVDTENSENAYWVIDDSKHRSHIIITRKKGWVDSSIEVDMGEEQYTTFNLYTIQSKSATFNKKYGVYRKQNQQIKNLPTNNLLGGIDLLFEEWEELQRIVFLGKKVYLETKTVEKYLVGELELPILEEYFLDYLCKDILSKLDLIMKMHQVLEGELPLKKTNVNDSSRNLYDHFIDPKL